jgi:hypothetical protein
MANGLDKDHLPAANGKKLIRMDNPKGSLFAPGGLYQKLHT